MNAPPDQPPIAMVLPHRERFGPDGAGAIAGVVRRLGAHSPRRVVVLGHRFDGIAFSEVAFRPVDAPLRLGLGDTRAYALGLLRALRRLPGSPIEVHNKPALAMLLARCFPRRPVRLLLHNDPRTMRGARTPRERARLLARLAGIATVSDHLRRCLLDGVPASLARPVAVVPNAIDPAGLPVPLPADRREPVFLFCGRVVADKAPDAFVAACARALPALPGWSAHVVGADGFTAGGRVTPFMRALAPAAAAAGVRLDGFLPHDQVLDRLSRAAVAVVPSRWDEPFGLTALEAMACGSALACSQRGGLAELCGDTALLFDPDDVEAGTAALLRLGRDPDLRARLGAAGRARALERFSIAVAIRALETFREGGAPPRIPPET